MPNTKIKVKTTWGKKETKSSIKIKAKTLGAALKALCKLDEWGKFDGKFDYSYDTDENDIVTAVTLKPSYLIEMPVWDGYKKSPKACQTEWDRMYKCLEKHEDGHRLIHLETLASIADMLGKATNLSVDDLKTDYDELVQKGQDNQDKFDTSTGHGSKKGVELTISKECE